MAAPIRFLSGRQQQQKIGIEGSTDNQKVLEVVGQVGIGTTVFEPSVQLEVRGDASVIGVLTAGSLNVTGDGGVPASLTVETLNATGVSTFGGAVDINAGLDVDGQSDLDEVVVAGVATFSNAVDINSTLDVDGDTQLDDLNVAGVSTFSSAVNATAAVNATDIIKGYKYTAVPYGSTVTLAVTVASKDSTHRYNGTGSGNGYVIDGIQAPFLTLTPGRTYRFTNDNTGSHPLKFYLEADKTTLYETNVNFQDAYTEITVTDETPIVLHYQCTAHGYMGNAVQTNANVVNTNYPATIRSTLDVSGVSTFTQLDVSTGGLDVDGLTNLDEVIVAGVSTFTGNIVAATAEFSGNVTIGGTLTSENKTNIDSVGLVTARTGVRVIAGGIDVTAGVSTFGGAVNFNDSVGVVGGLTADSLTISGVTTGINAAGISSFVRIDVDGQADLDEVIIAGVATFQGAVNFDVNSEVNIGTGVTILGDNLHVTGIISAAQFIGDGSGITNLPGISTLGSSNLTDVNVSGTTTTVQLRVSGVGTAEKFFVSTGGLEVDGQSDLDELVVAGVSTFSANTFINADLSVTGDIGASGIITATGINLVAGSGLDVGAVGVLTALSVDVSTGGIDVDGQSNLDEVVIAGVTTFNALADVNNRLDVAGGANIDQLNVAGIASFTQLDVSTGGIDVDGQATLDEVVVSGASTFTGTVKIDGALDIGVAGVDVEGLTNLDELIVAGVSTFTGAVDINAGLDVDGQTDLDELQVAGVSTFSAKAVFNTAYPSIDADNEIQVGTAIQLGKAGVVTATSFVGDGSLITGIGTQGPDGAFRGITVAGISTFNDDVRILAGGLNVTGVVTATSFSGDGSALTGIDASSLKDSGSTIRVQANTSGAVVTGVLTATSYDIELNDLGDATTSSTSLLLGTGVSSNSTENTVVGQNAGAAIDSRKNTYVGYEAGRYIEEEENTGIGNQALGGATGSVQTGYIRRNTAVGDRSLSKLEGSASDNTAVGAYSGDAITTGTSNTLIGSSAGTAVTTGGSNTFVGYACGYDTISSNNTGLGARALEDNITGTNNVAIGYQALYNSTASKNTALGYQAGDVITTGQNNICIGYDADASSATASNEITLGDSGITTFRIPGIGVTFGEGGADISGIVTAVSFSGSGANLTGIAATAHVSTFDLVVAGISTFVGVATFKNDAYFTGSSDKNLVWDSSDGNLEFADNAKATFGFGTGGDLQIWHDGTSYIKNTEGELRIASDTIRIGNEGNTENFIVASADGAVVIYHDALQKFSTSSSGITVTGTASASNVSAIGGNYTGIVTATSFSGSGANLTGVGTQGIDVQAQSLTVAGVSTFIGNARFETLSGGGCIVSNSSSGSGGILQDSSNHTLSGDTLTTVNIIAQGNITVADKLIHRSDDNTTIRFPANDTIAAETAGVERLRINSVGDIQIAGIVTATGLALVAGSGLDAGATGIVTAVGAEFNGTSHIKLPAGSTGQRPGSPTAGDLRYNSDDGAFEGYTDSWGAIGGGTPEVDTNVSSTSAVGVGSFATASFRSAEVIAQIVQIDEYQVGKYLMIHDGTTVTVIEQAAVSTGDSMIGSFDGAINGSNAELRVNMVTSGIATVTTKISTVTV